MSTSNFDLKNILQQAQQRSGLTDFADTYFLAALEKLLFSLEHEAQLHDAGIFSQQERIINLLVNRLRIEALINKHPEINNEEIIAPIIILGLPRTGTTLLSRVLSSDPRFYALYWWESRNPTPLQNESLDGPSPRIELAETMVEQMLKAVPQLASIHPFDARAHDEEILLLEHTFYSTVPESGAYLPSYQRWLEQQDQSRAYADLKRMLQCLQWQKKQRGETAQRWVLKTPHHLHFMPTVFKTFDDALFIHTHRDPVETLPSMASMYTTLHQLSSDAIDKKLIAHNLLQKWSASLKRCADFKSSLANLLDTDYRAMLNNPQQVLEKIYKRCDMSFDASTKKIIDTWLADNKRENRGTHHYTLDEFDLTRDDIEQSFLDYRQSYILNT